MAIRGFVAAAEWLTAIAAGYTAARDCRSPADGACSVGGRGNDRFEMPHVAAARQSVADRAGGDRFDVGSSLRSAWAAILLLRAVRKQAKRPILRRPAQTVEPQKMLNPSEQSTDPNPTHLSRRSLLSGVGLSAAACAVAASPVAVARAAADGPNESNPFRFGMNTSTLRGQKLPIAELVELVAKAGYQAIEPWVSELEDHVHRGGSLKDLGKRIRDLGLTVESSIALFRMDRRRRRPAGKGS